MAIDIDLADMPVISEYLPVGASVILKVAEDSANRAPVLLTAPVARAALKGLAVTALGGGLGYASGKLLGRTVGPNIPPSAYGALGLILSGAAAGAQLAHDKKFMEVLRRANENNQDRAGRR